MRQERHAVAAAKLAPSTLLSCPQLTGATPGMRLGRRQSLSTLCASTSNTLERRATTSLVRLAAVVCIVGDVEGKIFGMWWLWWAPWELGPARCSTRMATACFGSYPSAQRHPGANPSAHRHPPAHEHPPCPTPLQMTVRPLLPPLRLPRPWPSN